MDLASECLFAVLGIDAILDGRKLHITQAMRASCLALPDKIRKEIRRFLNTVEFDDEIPLPEFDYKAAFQQMTELDVEKRINDLAAAVSGDPEATGVMAVAGSALRYLSATMPRRARQGLTGPVQVRPSDQDVSRFRRAHAVLEDPMTVMADLCEGTLGRQAVDALRAVFPALYQRIAGDDADQPPILFEELLRLKETSPAMEILGQKARMLQVLMGLPAASPAVVVRFQANFDGVDETKVQPNKPLGNKAGGMDDVSTPTQRVAAR